MIKLNKKIITIAAGAVIAIAFFCYLYTSFSTGVKKGITEYNALESQLEEARLRARLIGKLKETGLDSEFIGKLLSKSDLPAILDTFMRTGKGCGVSLPSIAPHEPQDVAGLSDIVKVPITINAESKCRNLGEFLGNLIKDLRAAMAQVDTIEIKKSGSGDEAKLEAVIELSMYVKK